MNKPSPPRQLRLAQQLSLALLLALVLLYSVTSALAPKFFWTLLLVPCFSLLAFVPGMLKHNPRAYDWLCFVLLVHFTMGVTNAMAPAGAWNDYLQTLLSVALFISAMMSSRWQKAWLRQSP